MRSKEQFEGTDRSLQRAWIKGAGFNDEELTQPLVMIANTYQDFSPENAHLRTIVDAVKAGVRASGQQMVHGDKVAEVMDTRVDVGVRPALAPGGLLPQLCGAVHALGVQR